MPRFEGGCVRVPHPSATRQHVLLHLLPFDLHVLSLPLAFILSQDQTLRCKKLLTYSHFLYLCSSCLLPILQRTLLASSVETRFEMMKMKDYSFEFRCGKNFGEMLFLKRVANVKHEFQTSSVVMKIFLKLLSTTKSRVTSSTQRAWAVLFNF